MKKKIAIIIAIVGILSQAAYAQSYTFRVLASNGKSTVKTDKTDWETLKTGAKLFKGDYIKLTQNGYLGLVHVSGKTMELKEDSTYSISKLSSKLLERSQNMVSKYANYVMTKLTPEQKEENRRKYASVTGSVERTIFDSDIYIYLPQSVSVLNDKSIIRWNSTTPKTDYVITLKNIFGEEVFELETSENSYQLDFKNEVFRDRLISNLLIIQVSEKDNKAVASQSVSVRQIEETNAQELLASLKQLEAYVGGVSSINSVILAEFYEENKLMLDAITSYENAIKLSPDVTYFQEAYDEFLIRNKLISPEDVDKK